MEIEHLKEKELKQLKNKVKEQKVRFVEEKA